MKYARREDAIIHALEIESAREPKDDMAICLKAEDSGGEERNSWSRDSTTMSHSSNESVDTEEVSTSEDHSNSAQELSQSGISFEESNHNSVPKVQSVQGRRRRTPNDSEDDGSEGIKRMRGLEDLGMGVVSKGKAQAVAVGVLEQVQQDSVLLCDSSNSNGLPVESPVNDSKDHLSTLKRKRTQVAHVSEFWKRKNRRRQLTKVLESSAMVSIPVMCDQFAGPSGSPLQGASDSKISCLESNESKRSISIVINNSPDSTGVSCENGVSLNTSEHTCDASHIPHKLKENEISSMPGLPENGSSDILFDVPFVGDEKHTAGFYHIFGSCSSGKPRLHAAGRQWNQSNQAETALMRNDGLHESGSTSSEAVPTNNISQTIEKGTSKWQSKGKRNSRHTNKNKKRGSRNSADVDDESDDFSFGSDLKLDSTSDSLSLHAKSKLENQVDRFPDWNKHVPRRERGEMKLLSDCSPIPQRSLPYRQSRFTVHPKYEMADFPTRNFRPDSSTLYDVEIVVKASHRPQHVPYVSLMSKLNGKAITGNPLTVEVLEDGSCDQLMNSIEWYHDSGEMGYETKSRTLPKQAFSPSKSPKLKRCGNLSKKTRKLSSLTGFHHNRREEERKPVVEKLKSPAIACVPIKVVFSRIHEAVNSSKRSTLHRVSTSSNP